MERDEDLILFLRRVVCWFLFPAILIPCGIIFLFVFLCFFWSMGDTFTVTALGWVILALGFFWCISFVAIIICLAIAFLRQGEIYDKKL
ncbi:MAG: hypothetical protein LBP59_01495 [Planctomycetaceae bacterium]|jgi:hypothetical protein|nr:hypothetical protein [Planctomycetaceae bacterium]